MRFVPAGRGEKNLGNNETGPLFVPSGRFRCRESNAEEDRAHDSFMPEHGVLTSD